MRYRSGAGKSQMRPVKTQPFLKLPEDTEVCQMVTDIQWKRYLLSGEPEVVVLCADLHRQPVNCPLEPCGVVHFKHDSGGLPQHIRYCTPPYILLCMPGVDPHPLVDRPFACWLYSQSEAPISASRTQVFHCRPLSKQYSHHPAFVLFRGYQ